MHGLASIRAINDSHAAKLKREALAAKNAETAAEPASKQILAAVIKARNAKLVRNGRGREVANA